MTEDEEAAVKAIEGWVELWHRVTDAADPDDGPLPKWEDVAAEQMPDWDTSEMSAEEWGDYMHAWLTYLAEDLVHARRASLSPTKD